MDSKNPGLVDGQNQLMLYFASKGLHVPYPVKNIKGNIMDKELIGKDDSKLTLKVFRSFFN